MDFVAADGSFAGFNTALLAEIGKRLNKNIELTQVDCASRSTALASGTVDVVFWVRGDKEGSKYANMTDAEYQAYIEERNSQLTEDEVKALEVLDSITSRKDDYTKDMPDGTVITEPYYVDIPVGVMTRAAYDATLEMINQAGAEG